MKKRGIFYLFWLFLLVFPSLGGAFSERLFFVGEEVKILTVASRHPESPAEAPAICEVFTRDEILRGGYRTLGEFLRTIPGLFLAPREADWHPYFRGIPNGFLLLYNGIPFTSDSTKAVYDLGEEIDLQNIERIEVVRGPSSVLWGPDAFAGLINLVPRSKGKPELRVLVGSPEKDFSISGFLPFRGSQIEGAINLYYYSRDLWREKYSFPGRRGRIGRSEFYEAVFSFHKKNSFKLFGRLSKTRHPFIMEGPEGFSWPGEKKTPLNFLKLEHRIKQGSNTIRTIIYYQYFYRRQKELSLTQKHRNHILYGEILFDHHFGAQNGLFTLGASWRHDWVRDATVKVRGYLPDFLKEKNRQFLPLVNTADFNTNLYSLFLQLRRRFKYIDLWTGIRFADHDHYNSELIHQIGGLTKLNDTWSLKFVYGTSYRTPYAAQFLGKQKLKKPEKLSSFSLELCYQQKNFNFFFSPFISRVSHHIAEDPFGGYSRPLKQHFLGLESGFKWQNPLWHLGGHISWVNYWGEKEYYRVLDYIIILPGEEPEVHYSFYNKEFNGGPKISAEIHGGLNFGKTWELFGRLSFIDDRDFVWLKTGRKKTLSSKFIFDLNLKYQQKNFSWHLSLKNLFDTEFYTVGRFSPVKACSFGVFTGISWRW